MASRRRDAEPTIEDQEMDAEENSLDETEGRFGFN